MGLERRLKRAPIVIGLALSSRYFAERLLEGALGP